MCLYSEKEALWFVCLFVLHLFEERNYIFTMLFNGSNIEILNMIHSAEMLIPESY